MVFTSDNIFFNIFFKVQTFLHEALPDEWLKALEDLRKLDGEILVPGHGEVCDKSYLDQQAAFIREWVGLVKGAIDRGMTKEEAVKPSKGGQLMSMGKLAFGIWDAFAA